MAYFVSADSLSFPQSCPGHQFAVLEIKAMLALLIPSIVFEPTEDKIIMNNK